MKYFYSVGMLALSFFFFQSLSTPVLAGSAPEFTSCDYEHSNGEITYCYHTEVWSGHAMPLTVDAVDPDGGSLSYEWDLQGDEIYETTGKNVYYTDTQVDGSGHVSVKVTDSEGLSSITWIVYDVLVHPAVPYSITPDVNPVLNTNTIHMSGIFYDHGPANQLLDSNAIWDWGDGTTSVGTLGTTVTYAKLHPLDSNDIGFVQVFGSHQYAEGGEYTVTLFTEDHIGEAETLSYEYVVVDEPPIPTVYAGGEYLNVPEGGSVELTAEGFDPSGETLTYEWDLDSDGIFETPGQTVVYDLSHVHRNWSLESIVRVTNESGGKATDVAFIEVISLPAVINNVTPDVNPMPISHNLAMAVNFTDPGDYYWEDGRYGYTGVYYTVNFDWGDGSYSSETDIVIGTGSATITGNHSYTEVGVYRVTVEVIDGITDTAHYEYDYIVVFDPSNSASGHGTVVSPLGAYTADPTLTGSAKFGFTSGYKNGATVPDGKAQFKFKAGDFSFNSDALEWLIVNQNGTNAQFKGTGKVNNQLAPNNIPYKFMIWTQDLTSGDTFRMKIWYEDNGSEVLVYDNGTSQVIESGKVIID